MNKRKAYGLLIGAIIIGVSTLLPLQTDAYAIKKDSQPYKGQILNFEEYARVGDLVFSSPFFTKNNATNAEMHCKDLNKFYRLPTPDELRLVSSIYGGSVERLTRNIPRDLNVPSKSFYFYTNKRQNNRLTQVYVHNIKWTYANPNYDPQHPTTSFGKLEVTTHTPKLRNFAKGDYAVCVYNRKEIQADLDEFMNGGGVVQELVRTDVRY